MESNVEGLFVIFRIRMSLTFVCCQRLTSHQQEGLLYRHRNPMFVVEIVISLSRLSSRNLFEHKPAIEA